MFVNLGNRVFESQSASKLQLMRLVQLKSVVQERWGLAAYPWITRDDTGEVMWKMDNSNAVQEGLLAHVVGDEPVLD